MTGSTVFIEKRVLSKLIASLKKAGWTPVSTWDGVEHVPTPTAKSVREAVFAVDEATVTFQNVAGKLHGVLLVGGNGADLISDYSFTDGDSDKFAAAMDEIIDRVTEIYG